MGDTGIPYATKTWNPVHGCTQVAQGCVNCWAKRVAETRLRGQGSYPADEPFRVVLDQAKLDEPLHWRKSQQVMACSMGDLLHDQVPDRYILAVLGIAALCQHHTVMLFTKRAERAVRLFESLERRAQRAMDDVFPHDGLNWCRWHVLRAAAVIETGRPLPSIPANPTWPPKNIWWVASASTQPEVDRIVPDVLRIPAALHGLSLEPLLEEVKIPTARYVLDPTHGLWLRQPGRTGQGYPDHSWSTRFGDARPFKASDADELVAHWNALNGPPIKHVGLGWVIVGAESGKDRRLMGIRWVEKLRDQILACGEAPNRPAFYLKQAGWVTGVSADDERLDALHVSRDGLFTHPFLDGREWREVPEAGR